MLTWLILMLVAGLVGYGLFMPTHKPVIKVKHRIYIHSGLLGTTYMISGSYVHLTAFRHHGSDLLSITWTGRDGFVVTDGYVVGRRRFVLQRIV